MGHSLSGQKTANQLKHAGAITRTHLPDKSLVFDLENIEQRTMQNLSKALKTRFCTSSASSLLHCVCPFWAASPEASSARFRTATMKAATSATRFQHSLTRSAMSQTRKITSPAADALSPTRFTPSCAREKPSSLRLKTSPARCACWRMRFSASLPPFRPISNQCKEKAGASKGTRLGKTEWVTLRPH